MNISEKKIRSFQEKIIDWYEENGRDFPWRNTTDPYKVVLAEFLLQKTHVRMVENVYLTLLDEYPNIYELSKAEEENILEIIKPLGFLNRANRLVNFAEKVCEEKNCYIPADYDYLMSIKGIGKYIATAVLIFAFGEKRVILDTNVIKILRKEFGIVSDKKRPRNDNKLWDFTQRLAPESNIRKFNWGLLDYGAYLD